jgi:hypothetical protein
MASKAFSYYNTLSAQTMRDGIAGALGKPLTYQDDVNPHPPGIHLTEDIVNRLKNIQNWWNLDRSEAARRAYIDAFVYEAMVKSKAPSLIVTAEEFISPDRTRAGHGYLDYLVSPIDADTGRPFYTPSVIIEAKAFIPGNLVNGQNQLLAEMLTVWQIKQTSQGFTHGVLTDGRFWKFYEMHMISSYLFASPFYDAAEIAQLTNVVGMIAKFFAMYDSGNSAFM